MEHFFSVPAVAAMKEAPRCFGDLDGAASDTAGTGVDEDAFALLKAASPDQGVVRGDPNPDTSPIFIADLIGKWIAKDGFGKGLFCIGAALDVGGHSLTDVEVLDSRAQGFDGSNSIEARNVRRLKVSIRSTSRFDVGEIDAGDVHIEADLPFLWDGLLFFLEDELFWASVGLDDNSLHFSHFLNITERGGSCWKSFCTIVSLNIRFDRTLPFDKRENILLLREKQGAERESWWLKNIACANNGRLTVVWRRLGIVQIRWETLRSLSLKMGCTRYFGRTDVTT